jgi:hypothetical protein
MPKGAYKKGKLQRKHISDTLSNRPQPWNKGKNHGLWVGDKVSYSPLHQWIRRNFGNPITCENKECKGKYKRYEWANINHKYKRVRKDWKMFCSSCHKIYDKEILGVKFGPAPTN